MCGITGFWQLNDFAAEGARATATQMAAAIAYRGPDDYGVWLDEGANFALAHRRLSIVDLSPAGHQPMLSASSRYVMAFNGEIYNHIEMRRELESLTPALLSPCQGERIQMARTFRHRDAAGRLRSLGYRGDP